MMGDLAEQWTASELRRLRRRGWHVVNHVPLDRRNLDHLLIGPGGVVAIETKWSATPWDLQLNDNRVIDAAWQVQACARTIGLWSHMKRTGAAVEPVVLLWGGGLSRHQDTPARHVAGCLVVSGPHARAWTDALPDDVLTSVQVDRLRDAVDGLLQMRDGFEGARSPEPPSMSRLAARGVLSVGAGAVTFLAIAQLHAQSRSLLVTAVAFAARVVAAAALLRAPRLEPAAWGVLFGSAVSVTVAVAAYLAAVVE